MGFTPCSIAARRAPESARPMVAKLSVKTGMGLVAQVFDEQSAAELEGIAAIGHTRYSTTGASRFRNAQPDPAR